MERASDLNGVLTMDLRWLACVKSRVYMIPSSSERADRESYQPVLDLIGDSSVVLIGEGTHGTADFFQERQKITKWLIEEKNFTMLCVEADWLDAQKCHCYVQNLEHVASAEEALSGFQRFPSWMWRNKEVKQFLEWLRDRNSKILRQAEEGGDKREQMEKLVGFYGLDIYSMQASLLALKSYLEEKYPEIAKKVLEHYDDLSVRGVPALREDSPDLRDLANSPVVEQLLSMLEQAGKKLLEEPCSEDARVASDLYFYAQQNARIMANARSYYRALLQGGQAAWNVREQHMFQTFMALLSHVRSPPGGRKAPAKAVVWAHNVHVGDARGMEMGWKGALSLGQMVRERSGLASVSVGFSTYEGTLTTADEWGGEPKTYTLKPAKLGSYEEIFHSLELPRFVLHLGSVPFKDPTLLQREIGVLYKPDKEDMCHYFHAKLSDQFDVIIHIDKSHAVEPL